MELCAMEAAVSEDADLVQESLEGNQLSFQLLVERYQDRMFSLVRHFTRSTAEVEDIVQETFLKAFRRLETFQRQASFSTWLYRIAVNTSLDFLKRRGRSPVQSVEDPELLVAAPGAARSPGVVAPDARLEQEEIARITHRVLEELPEIFRTVLVLRELEDMAYQEMADLLGISIGTVESRLFRARARFREKLLRLYPDADRRHHPQVDRGERRPDHQPAAVAGEHGPEGDRPPPGRRKREHARQRGDKREPPVRAEQPRQQDGDEEVQGGLRQLGHSPAITPDVGEDALA